MDRVNLTKSVASNFISVCFRQIDLRQPMNFFSEILLINLKNDNKIKYIKSVDSKRMLKIRV